MRAAVLGGLILLAAASAAAQDEVVPPAPAPPGSASKRASADPTMESVVEAMRSGKYQEALDGARRLVAQKPALPRDDLLHLALTEAESCLFLGRFEEAILAADRGPGLFDPQWTSTEAWTRRFSGVKALALVRSGRFTEGAKVLDDLVRVCPAAASELMVHAARAILKASDGYHVDPVYEGNLAGTPRVAAVLKRLDAALPLAFDAVRRRVGDLELKFPPVLVKLWDELPPEAAMDAHVVKVGSRWMGFIRVCAQCAIAGEGEETLGLAHELTHVLRGAGSGASPLEDWEEEGLAHWVEEERERQMWEWIVFKTAKRTRLSAILDLPEDADPKRPWGERSLEEQRVLGALLFRHLERTRGRESVRAYARALFRPAEDPKESFRAAFGADRLDVQREVRSGLRRWMRSALDGLDELAGLREAQESGNIDVMARAGTEFLSGHPESILRPFVLYGLFQRYMDSGRREDATGLLDELRTEQPTWYGPILACEFQLARARSDFPEVVRLGTEALTFSHGISDSMRTQVQGALDDAKKRLAEAVPPAAEPAPR